MKKTIALLTLVLTFSMTTQAQKRHHDKKGENLTEAQKTTLAVKKMTLNLNLTDSQQNKIRPLIAKKMAAMSKMKESRKNHDTDVKVDHFQIQNDKLDKMIAFKREMMSILNANQFEKFEKLAKKKMHKRMMQHKGKGKEKGRDHPRKK